MSIKKELLNELSKKQLTEIAEEKSIKFNNLNSSKKEYYEDWDEKKKMVDLMSEKEDLTVREIEDYLKAKRNL